MTRAGSRVLIFSGSRELFLTSIQYEVKSLIASGYIVDIFLEHCDQSILLGDLNINYHIKNPKHSLINELISISFFLKRMKFVRLVKKLIKQGCNTLIIHNEIESYANFASNIFFENDLDVYILKPSPIISIDSDWIWLKQLTSKIRWFLDKFFFEIFIPFFIFKKFLLTNKRWVPCDSGTIRPYSGPARAVMCYDANSKLELLNFFSNVVQIDFPNRFQSYSCRTSYEKEKKILIVPSNDAWFYASINGISVEHAKKLIYKFIFDFSKKCVENNLIVEIKFKYDWQVIEFNSIYGDENKITTFYDGDVYSFAQNYEFIAGFNTTILLYLKLMGYKGNLISLQLIEHKFYRWYEKIEGISFFKAIKDINFSSLETNRALDCNTVLVKLSEVLER